MCLFICWDNKSILNKIIDAVAAAEQRDTAHDAGNDAIDGAQRAWAEVVAYLVDGPCDEQPPADGTTHQTTKSYEVEPPVLGRSLEQEVGTSKEGYVKEDDERIADRDAKA